MSTYHRLYKEIYTYNKVSCVTKRRDAGSYETNNGPIAGQNHLPITGLLRVV